MLQGLCGVLLGAMGRPGSKDQISKRGDKEGWGTEEGCRHLGWKPDWQVHARALGAVAVGAPISRLPTALAGDTAPHLHRNASLRAPSNVAAQLLSGPFWGPHPKKREGTRSRHGLGYQSDPLDRGRWGSA